MLSMIFLINLSSIRR